jgi:hypothetical protein
MVAGPLLLVLVLGTAESFRTSNWYGGEILVIAGMMLFCLAASGIALYQNRHMPLVPVVVEASP